MIPPGAEPTTWTQDPASLLEKCLPAGKMEYALDGQNPIKSSLSKWQGAGVGLREANGVVVYRMDEL
jgi:hypothetical protein